jgi:diadenosine tetraphosphate (Ap4A) HIT family hydrolase
VARTPRLRVIRADEPGFPAFYRVVWNAHVAEFTDLAPADRVHCMEAVAVVESALRRHLAPDKVNLAALGNMVPHLHWHVIARWTWDSHFPAPVWAAAARTAATADIERVVARRAALEADLASELARRG